MEPYLCKYASSSLSASVSFPLSCRLGTLAAIIRLLAGSPSFCNPYATVLTPTFNFGPDHQKTKLALEPTLQQDERNEYTRQTGSEERINRKYNTSAILTWTAHGCISLLSPRMAREKDSSPTCSAHEQTLRVIAVNLTKDLKKPKCCQKQQSWFDWRKRSHLVTEKMNATVVSVCVMFVLFITRETASISPELQVAANAWQGSLPCGGWNCECAARQQSCCCAAAQMDELEEQMFTRLMNSFSALSELKTHIQQITACREVAFTASMSQMSGCFGPFTSDLPIPYSNTTLNHGNGYNPALGIFTTPCAGVFSFSLTVYSNKGSEGQRLYQRVALVRQGRSEVATWEDNREDAEDSATQTVLFNLRAGEQVYAQLMSGREICGDIWGRNIFSGYLLYPAES
ncbi:hypothetical protein QQF64_027787 [Cirrhinus molitorella]|uniref:C1q domain-containing protein n=1 Tax=Cirrhinus molitorella TaxID=172907 RepID=A0ABR3NE34_9TELE